MKLLSYVSMLLVLLTFDGTASAQSSNNWLSDSQIESMNQSVRERNAAEAKRVDQLQRSGALTEATPTSDKNWKLGVKERAAIRQRGMVTDRELRSAYADEAQCLRRDARSCQQLSEKVIMLEDERSALKERGQDVRTTSDKCKGTTYTEGCLMGLAPPNARKAADGARAAAQP